MAGEPPEVPAERSDAAAAGGGGLDLKHYGTSDSSQGAQSGRGEGYIVHWETGKVVRVDPPWLRRAKRAKRAGEAWLMVWQPMLDKGRAQLLAFSVTYRDVEGWDKRQIAQLMQRVRVELGGRLLDYYWVAELQERGAVHYNVVLVVRPGTRIPKVDEAGWWVHGSSKTYGYISGKRAAYFMRYVGKEGQKGGDDEGPRFPPGLRLYGMRLARTVGEAARRLVRFMLQPKWLRDAVGFEWVDRGYLPRKCKGGGYWFAGRRMFSPWAWCRTIAETVQLSPVLQLAA